MFAVTMLQLCILLSPHAIAQEASENDAVTYSEQIKASHKAYKLENREEALTKLKLTSPKQRGWEYHYLLGLLNRNDGDKGNQKHTFAGSGFHIEGLAFTANDKQLVIGSAQKPAKLWDLGKRESIDLQDSKSVSGAVAASPDGNLIATDGGNGSVLLWDVTNQKRILQYTGHHLSSDAPYGQTALIVKSISFSSDSKRIVSAAYTATSGVHQKGEVKIWSVESGQTLVSLAGPHEEGPRYITTATFSPDNKLIATGSFDKKLKLWDSETGKLLREFEGHAHNVLSVAFSPDGKRVASASADNTVLVWDVERGDKLVRLTGHTKPVFSVKFSPDGKRIVSGSWDETVRLWDAEYGIELLTLEKMQGPVLCVTIAHDGKKIAAGVSLRNSQEIADATVWNIETTSDK